jgi:hypothetical protein
MAPKKKSPLHDPDNDPVFEEVPDSDPKETEGMSVEDAYRHLASMPPEPVVEPEEN